jgi:hypothetical protein
MLLIGALPPAFPVPGGRKREIAALHRHYPLRSSFVGFLTVQTMGLMTESHRSCRA